MDAVVVVDDVFVPWENVLLHRDVKRCNEAYARTGAVVHMTHQVVVKNIAKCEFLLGLASLMVSTIGAEIFRHVQEKCGFRACYAIAGSLISFDPGDLTKQFNCWKMGLQNLRQFYFQQLKIRCLGQEK